MSVPPDDLPRSASGRLPQWVIDEATGRPVTPDPWRSDTPSTPPRAPRRRRWLTGAALALMGAGVGGWWLYGTPGLPANLESALPAPPGTAQVTPAAPPSPEVVALADAAHLSTQGRALFYATAPEVLDAASFAGRCVRAGQHDGATVGCYTQGPNTITIYAPADPRLYPSVVDTAAHELLHAAWAQLTSPEQTSLAATLEAEAALLPADAPVLAQITASVGRDPGARPTELFAYIGTQVWRDGGLDPELEAVYARYIDDRAALVAAHTGLGAQLAQMETAIEAAAAALAATRGQNATDRAQYDADVTALTYYRQTYEAKAAEVAALPPQRAAQLQLSWVWWDGTDLPMAPADQTLATAAALLARDERALPARAADLDARDAAAAAEQARIDALVADLRALRSQMSPPA